MESLTESNQFECELSKPNTTKLRSRYDLWKMYSHKSCNKSVQNHIVIKPFVRKSVSPINRQIYSSTSKFMPVRYAGSLHNSETNLSYQQHYHKPPSHKQQQQQQQNQKEFRRNSFDGGFGYRNDRGGGSGDIKGRRFVGGSGSGGGGCNYNGNELWNRSAKCIVCVSVFNNNFICFLVC